MPGDEGDAGGRHFFFRGWEMEVSLKKSPSVREVWLIQKYKQY